MGRWLLAAYAVLLLISYGVRARQPDDAYLREPNSAAVRAVVGDREAAQVVHVAYKEYLPERAEDAPAVVLLHGSPGSKEDFSLFAPRLARDFRVIVPDLPGFGSSTSRIPDYSFRAHARYVLELLDQLHVQRAHLVAFSMGGGVALNVADLAPARVSSVVMLSAIGVQEMELLGDYNLNHALHGLQLAGLWLLREGVPHMGYVGGAAYARNFYDSDQRPLRAVLERYAAPMLIIHGRGDVLVPVEAALEHQRLVPQSELQLLDDNHFMVFTRARVPADLTSDFLARVERGQAVVRANADPARAARARQPFDPADVPPAKGVAAVVMLLLLAALTLVSEDLTCIGAGVLAAQGRISFPLAASACLLGIFVGDLLLFLAGRYLGRPALRRAPLRWLVRPADVERSSAWFNRRGSAVILLSRFLPGARLPTYFAAGLLNTSFWKFSLYFFAAAAVWTPLLVGLAMILGAEALKSSLVVGQGVLFKALASGLLVFVVVKLLIRLSSFRGRRLLLSRLRRLARWEFWPPWAFYPPVVCYVALLGLKHRGLTVFTCANPAMPGGGFVGESKIEILRGLSASPASRAYVARAALLPASTDDGARLALARGFMEEHGLTFPVVLKPDAGQRGSGVAVVRTWGQLEEYLCRARGDTIIQEYVAGLEFGVFYYRHPEADAGRIFSITEKRFPCVTGDGRSTLERLILEDERAVCMARAYFDVQREHLWDVPEEGRRVQLVELGTHCRGAVFLDGGWVETKELAEAVDRLSKSFEGFHFGRFDIRTPSLEDFRRGENFKVVELNGVTSEATHIYDPQNGLFNAYRTLFEQWRIAFEIGARNRARGVAPTPLRALFKSLLASVEQAQGRPAPPPAARGNINCAPADITK